MERYLINYLKNVAVDPLVRKYVDYFKVELDWFIYNYGEQMAYRRDKEIPFRVQLREYKSLLKAHFDKVVFENSNNNVLSSIPHKNFVDGITAEGFNQYSSIFQPVGTQNVISDRKALSIVLRKRKILRKGNFIDLYNKSFFQEIEDYKELMREEYKKYNFRGLFLYTDEYFESKLLIEMFRSLNKPSFVFSHGLPGYYNLDTDNRTDYLMVWGERIKEMYLKTGFAQDKVFVVGNAKYKKVPKFSQLRNTYDDVLVIPVSSSWWHQHEWTEPIIEDRSMIVLYLYEVQHVLQKIGIKHARFRPHPSFEKEWVYSFLDHDFYSIDYEELNASLSHTSLIVGATSSVFLEALMAGVNYVIFEPINEDTKTNLVRLALLPPFDGTDKGLEIAHTEDALLDLLRDKYEVDTAILEGYIQPLDLSILHELM